MLSVGVETELAAREGERKPLLTLLDTGNRHGREAGRVILAPELLGDRG
jgi:hypothetical protein